MSKQGLKTARGPVAMSYAGQTPNIPRAKKMDLSVIAGNNPARPRVFMPMEAPAPDVPPTFDHLMLPHLDAAYNLARWLLRNDQDAEDAVQESCLRAWRAFDRFRGGDARAWLLTIVRNVCYTHLRQIRREPVLEEFSDESQVLGDAVAELNAAEWLGGKSDQLPHAPGKIAGGIRRGVVLP